MPIFPVVVTWKGASFNIKLDTAEPVEKFRLQLQTLTGVPCAGQKLMGFPGGVLKASSWTEIALKGDKYSVVMSGESVTAPAPASATATVDVLQPSHPPSSSEGASSSSETSSSLAKLLKVTVKTAQGAAMCLPDLPADCLMGRIKLLLSQPPHSCGQPVAMKLAYKGKLHACICFSSLMFLSRVRKWRI
jgi:hypothetical protein